jgi:hypothetical protein
MLLHAIRPHSSLRQPPRPRGGPPAPHPEPAVKLPRQQALDKVVVGRRLHREQHAHAVAGGARRGGERAAGGGPRRERGGARRELRPREPGAPASLRQPPPPPPPPAALSMRARAHARAHSPAAAAPELEGRGAVAPVEGVAVLGVEADVAVVGELLRQHARLGVWDRGGTRGESRGGAGAGGSTGAPRAGRGRRAAPLRRRRPGTPLPRPAAQCAAPPRAHPRSPLTTPSQAAGSRGAPR